MHGAVLAWRRVGAADPEEKISVQNGTGRAGRTGRDGRKEEKSRSNGCTRGQQHEWGPGGKVETRELWEVQALSRAHWPCLWRRGSGRPTQHNKSRVPAPGTELRELPRQKGSQKLVSGS